MLNLHSFAKLKAIESSFLKTFASLSVRMDLDKLSLTILLDF
ncbi:hypothetical protein P700755_003562 [Psychroflexus torquis ATCC 700755]|uniref:Uncharacterized protein n=1 Tax=Psychroflexus torquis (strain ATCC 700755 / CIP 106069 / ACAM 623) TaxID=313595 RepID=K4IK27_PSYTT|nr:hypothetical protein P700755_003562 [Psychroflexus torquis ATCC 700755]